MAFYDRLYDLYLMLGSPAAPPIWEWATWQQAAGSIDPLVQSARGSPAVRVHLDVLEADAEPGQSEFPYHPESAALWIAGAPGSKLDPETRFLSFELWAPDWETCKQENKLPDVYMAFRNEAAWVENPPVNPMLILSVAADLPRQVLSTGKRTAEQIAGLVQARLRAYQRRPWGYAWSDGAGFTDGIGDLLALRIYRLPEGSTTVHSPLELDTFPGEWDYF